MSDTASNSQFPEVERVEAVEIRPNDIILIHLPGSPSMEDRQQVAQAWYHITGLQNSVMVVAEGMEIEVRRPE